MFGKVAQGLTALCALIMLTMSATADRVVLTPSAYNLPPGSAKLEIARRESKGGLTQYWMNLGLVGGIEVEGLRLETSSRHLDTLSLQYNILPDIGFTPAISAGVRDIANKTAEGRAIYLAVGYRLPYMPPNPFIDEMYLFGGVGAGGIKGAFLGTEVRTPYHILLSVEYDSRAWNAVLSWEPVPLLRLRLYSLDKETYYGASLSVSF
ncbi:MAG: hypothetical protein C4335_06110 [Armatimonadota bacterium]